LSDLAHAGDSLLLENITSAMLFAIGKWRAVQ
jgi:hypothetical protein